MATVLIADDEPDALESYQEVVEALGHRALVAPDGECALRLIHREHPAVVITDHMMPHMTGVELMRALRREPECAAMPVVLLSSMPPPGRDEAWRFMQKPVALEAFEQAVIDAVEAADRNRLH